MDTFVKYKEEWHPLDAFSKTGAFIPVQSSSVESTTGSVVFIRSARATICLGLMELLTSVSHRVFE